MCMYMYTPVIVDKLAETISNLATAFNSSLSFSRNLNKFDYVK